jgi:hypothetical protein
MIRRLTLLALLCSSLLADGGTKPKVQATNTERMDFPSGGLLRLKNSAGEVQIQGWDSPQVEITTIKSTQDFYAPDEQSKGAALLDQVKVVTERQNQEIVVTTTLPRYKWLSLNPGVHLSVDLLYLIKVPRSARLAIAHGEGEVHVAEVTGDIHATVRAGAITLSLAPEAHYDIDARSRVGSVFSDFPGNERTRLWFLNHQFAEHPSGAAEKLYLRIGFGDIVLLKKR